MKNKLMLFVVVLFVISHAETNIYARSASNYYAGATTPAGTVAAIEQAENYYGGAKALPTQDIKKPVGSSANYYDGATVPSTERSGYSKANIFNVKKPTK